MKICNQDISKIIKARSFKGDQLIEDGEQYSLECQLKLTCLKKEHHPYGQVYGWGQSVPKMSWDM